MHFLYLQRKQTNLCGHGLQIRAIVAEINLRNQVIVYTICMTTVITKLKHTYFL